MALVCLTDRFCASAKPIKGARTDYFDEQVPGLHLRVTDRGVRTWSFIFTAPSGKRARATLGRYPAVSLAAARAKAIQAAGLVQDGVDPRQALAGAAAGLAVAGLVDVYLGDPETKSLRSWADIERRLKKNVVPVIGGVKLAELHKRDVRSVVDAIQHRGARTESARVFDDLRTMVRWAVQRDYLDTNPMDGMERPAVAAPRERVLSDEEIATLWNGLPKALGGTVQCRRIIKLCLVTAQRVGEVAGMVPAELDLNAREWRIPGARTKNKFTHVVPLSNLACEIIKAAQGDAGEGKPLFPSGNGSLSPVAVAHAILRANKATADRPLGRFGIAPWTAHDLRRTALTGMARLGVPPITLGHVANHRSVTRGGVTLAVYSQYTYDKEKRAALDLWVERLAAIVGDGAAKVLPLRGKEGRP